MGPYTSDDYGVLQGTPDLDPNKIYYTRLAYAPDEYTTFRSPYEKVEPTEESTIIHLIQPVYGKIGVHSLGIQEDGSREDLEGIEVEIRNEKGELVETITTGPGGVAESGYLLMYEENPDQPWDLSPVKYTITQVTGVEGYTKPEPIATSRNQLQTPDEKYELINLYNPDFTTIKKVDEDSKQGLSGAKFAVYKYVETPKIRNNGIGPQRVAGYTEPPILAEDQVLYNKNVYTKLGEYTTDQNGEIKLALRDKEYIDTPLGIKEVGVFYLIKEINAPDGYKVDTSLKELTNPMTIENTPLEKVSIYAKKTWKGGDGSEKPDVLFQLYQDGRAYGQAKPLDKDSLVSWSVPKATQHGNEYKYSVDELQVPDNYTKSDSITGEGSQESPFVIVNKYTPGLRSHTVKVTWAGVPEEKPPVEIVLYRSVNGKEERVDSTMVPGINNPIALGPKNLDTYIWSSLPMADEEGNPITYFAREVIIGENMVVDGKAGDYTVTESTQPGSNVTEIHISRQAKPIDPKPVDPKPVDPKPVDPKPIYVPVPVPGVNIISPGCSPCTDCPILPHHIQYIIGRGNYHTMAADESITRAEVATIFARLMYMDEDYSSDSKFTDVDRGKWYSNYISFLEDKDILSGYPDGSFKPNDPISRSEFAAIASKYSKEYEEAKFSDLETSHWAFKAIGSSFGSGYITGYPNGSFMPDRDISRAEAVKIPNKICDRVADKGFIDNNKLDRQFTDLSRSHWVFYELMEAAHNHDYKRLLDNGEQWDNVLLLPRKQSLSK